MYVAFVEGVCTKLLASLHRVKKVAWVHSDLIQLSWTLEKGIYQNREKEIKAYKQFDKVICVSHSVERMMCEHYGLEKVCTIYNPIDESDIEKKKELPCTIAVSYTHLIRTKNAEYRFSAYFGIALVFESSQQIIEMFFMIFFP